MKTKLFIMLLILSAVLLTASTYPYPPTRLQTVEGTLRFGFNTCGPPDYVTNEAMDKVYLYGTGFPTRGQYAGCDIYAQGYYTSLDPQTGCSIFRVQSYRLSCGGITSSSSLSSSSSSDSVTNTTSTSTIR